MKHFDTYTELPRRQGKQAQLDLAQQQLNLETRTLARNHDAPSSHRAAENQARSGKLASDKQRVLALVKKHPGRSAKILAQYTDIDYHTVMRRLNDLRHDGLIKKDGVYMGLTAWVSL